MQPLLSTACSLFCALAAHAGTRPNVLFLMADDFRPEIASYGSVALTPNLDRLAQAGLQFDRAYCQQAVCNPSRSSLLTGRRPDTLRIWNNSTHFRELNPSAVTLPQWFLQNGYTTRCTGKIFHNWHTKEQGDRRSWSAPEFLHYANHGDDAPQVTGPLPPNLSTANIRNYGNGPICECRDVPDEAYYDGRVAAEAVKVLAEIKNQPFFLAVGFWKPHAPFNAPKKYWDLYTRDRLPPLDGRRPDGAPEIAFHTSSEILGGGPGKVTPTAAQAAEWRHGYYANVSYLDAQIGKVLAALEAHGLTGNTIIAFTSDHGYHLGEHSLWGKTSTFEYDARVPLLFSGRGIQAGVRTRSLAELTDLFPTLTALCGLDQPAGLQGRSLLPILHDPSASVHEAAFTQHPRPAYYDREPSGLPAAMGYSARTDRVRYTEWREWKTGKVIGRELYDQSADPRELRNLADDASVAQEQERAARLLLEQFPLHLEPEPSKTSL
ncbi:MAG: iduronate 2-sulfatase [Verrucomicrobia bacterium]|nr:MAG: iduronate 2-sulfatase [Verrucomicrobiota bacterium]